MEGPNPASILRNSVVVACGAYVLIKPDLYWRFLPVLTVLVVIGTVTAIEPPVAIAQIDIKRALSHSTSAYCVFIAVGMQWPVFALLLLTMPLPRHFVS